MLILVPELYRWKQSPTSTKYAWGDEIDVQSIMIYDSVVKESRTDQATGAPVPVLIHKIANTSPPWGTSDAIVLPGGTGKIDSVQRQDCTLTFTFSASYTDRRISKGDVARVKSLYPPISQGAKTSEQVQVKPGDPSSDVKVAKGSGTSGVAPEKGQVKRGSPESEAKPAIKGPGTAEIAAQPLQKSKAVAKPAPKPIIYGSKEYFEYVRMFVGADGKVLSKLEDTEAVDTEE